MMMSSRWDWLQVSALLLLGSFGFAAAWIVLGSWYGRLLSPLAVVAALDAVLLLSLARFRRGVARVVLALVTTSAMTLMAMGALVSTRIGAQLGLLPWDAFRRLGLESGWFIMQLSLDRVDWAWLLAGLVVAVVLSR